MDTVTMTAPPPLLSIQDLRVRFRVGKDLARPGHWRWQQAVGSAEQGVQFDVPANTTVALVGESGSGKSVTAMSLLQLLPANAECTGQLHFEGRDLLQASTAEIRALRGRAMACVFQDPMSSLNPVLTIGAQLCEPLRLHQGLGRREAWARAEALLEEVGMPEPRRRLSAYPHELSGGQQQRVMIAMALSCEPRLLIADEPTTALDVTIQRQILDLLARIKAQRRMSLLFISHDLGVVGEIADEVVVMRHGLVREQGPVAQIFTQPQDRYTQALLACRPQWSLLQETEGGVVLPPRLPTIDEFMAQEPAPASAPAPAPAPASSPTMPAEANAPTAADAAPVVLEARQLGKSFWLRQGLFGRREFKAVQQVSFTLRRGRTLGIVGESGSGKSTLGLTLLRLHEATHGEVLFDGRNLLTLSGAEQHQLRRRIQIVFQNPYASLNPRFTIGETLLEPMRIHGIGANDTARVAHAMSLLERVGLTAEAFGKYPHEFSGGQRQRIAIARALTVSPEVLVLDEAVSALDVSVQAQVLNLLKDLQAERGLAYVFISHDLAVVRFMADEVLVMQAGQVVEQAPAAQLMRHPRQDYTRRLLGSMARGYDPQGGRVTPSTATP